MPLHALPTLADTLPEQLRPLRASDAAAWSHYLSLPGVIEHTSWGDTSEQALAQQITRYLADASDWFASRRPFWTTMPARSPCWNALACTARGG